MKEGRPCGCPLLSTFQFVKLIVSYRNQDTQNNPRPGEQESYSQTVQSCGGGTALHEAERGRQEGGRWH